MNSTFLYTTIDACRICSSTELEPIIDMGNQPPANSLRSDLLEQLPAIPLTISRCKNCAAIQLNETVRPEYLFKNYVWVTGTSKTAEKYSELFYEQMVKRCELSKVFAIEVASNDGTFLKRFKDHGHKVIGVDPAQNIAKIANDNGVPTVNDFFSATLARDLIAKEGLADCIFARNVIPHVEHVHDVVEGMALCLKENGVGAIEFHHSMIILQELHYDSIYHEHLCYHTLHSISQLLSMHGLHPIDMIQSPISGGSIVLYFSKQQKTKSTELINAIATENKSGVNEYDAWIDFAKKSYAHRAVLKAMVEQENDKGRSIIGYGASARSSTLLNFCGISNYHLKCVADQNSIKHGKYTPGTDIPILSPQKALALKPDVVLLLAWNFKNEILSVLKNEHSFHGSVILPLPGDPHSLSIG